MKGGIAVAWALVLVAGSSCGVGENCSQAACGSGPSVTVLLTVKDDGQTIPITPKEAVGVLLPGKSVITVSDPSRLAALPVPNQPPGQTFRIFNPIYEPLPNKPWTFGGKVTLSSPAEGKRGEWHVTLIMGTDPPAKIDGLANYASYFIRTDVNIAIGETFSLNWPVGLVPPSSSDDKVLAPVTGIVTIDEGRATIGVTRVTAGPRYEQQLFVAVGEGTAVLTGPQAAKGGCEIKDTQGTCLQSTTVHVESRPNWTCSVDSGCTQVNWDGVSRDRPDQYQR